MNIPLATILTRVGIWQGLSQERGDVVNAQNLLINEHTGTHVDATRHIKINAKTIEEFPIDSFIGEAIVLNFSKKGKGHAITEEDLKKWEQEKKLILSLAKLYFYEQIILNGGNVYHKVRAILRIDLM